MDLGWRKIEHIKTLQDSTASEDEQFTMHFKELTDNQDDGMTFYNTWASQGEFSNAETWEALGLEQGFKPVPAALEFPPAYKHSEVTFPVHELREWMVDAIPHTQLGAWSSISNYKAVLKDPTGRIQRNLDNGALKLPSKFSHYRFCEGEVGFTLKAESPPRLLLVPEMIFTDPDPAVVAMVQVLQDAADVPAPAGDPPDDDAHHRGRNLVKKHVSIVALSLHEKHSVTYLRMYHEVFKKLGKHPVVESQRLGMSTHLDGLCSIPLGIETALEVLNEMLTV